MKSKYKSLLANKSVCISLSVLLLLLALAILAPWLCSVDPAAMDYDNINQAPGTRTSAASPGDTSLRPAYLLGTDSYGRDIFSRVIYGTRVSLLVGSLCATLALLMGGVIGMTAGYLRAADGPLMRLMDGLMAIPAILLAIILVAVLGASLPTVLLAIAIPEVPRVTRLVRSLVLGLREEPYVEAAKALGTSTPTILARHILPNAVAPLLVQGTFIAAAAVLTEAVLSFLGLGLPPEVPTWGNVMADGRVNFTEHPGHVLFPAMLLVPTVLAINMLGDGLRDVLDPKFSRRGGGA